MSPAARMQKPGCPRVSTRELERLLVSPQQPKCPIRGQDEQIPAVVTQKDTELLHNDASSRASLPSFVQKVLDQSTDSRLQQCKNRVWAVAADVEVEAGQAVRKFLLLFNRVLVEQSAAETVTKAGIILTVKSPGKVSQAAVVALWSGPQEKGAETQSVSMKVGDKILLLEYGGPKVLLDHKVYFLFRDDDILGKHFKSLLKSHQHEAACSTEVLKSFTR
ncbi:uncharacterized protein LOC105869271 [Microcebus murinus]|uniref:uncharacterized protein LOC105869271 n=1 Tax=Microcebus murinus TaxID=30608 RepID=UPI003F6A645B